MDGRTRQSPASTETGASRTGASRTGAALQEPKSSSYRRTSSRSTAGQRLQPSYEDEQFQWEQRQQRPHSSSHGGSATKYGNHNRWTHLNASLKRTAAHSSLPRTAPIPSSPLGQQNQNHHRNPPPKTPRNHSNHHQPPSTSTQKSTPLPAPHAAWDEPDGHYIIELNADLSPRYKILQLLGQGTFGKVVECFDRFEGRRVAVKIIRAVPKYRDAAKQEIRVLRTLKEHDPMNANNCIHLLDVFDFRNHICMVFELLSVSVFDFLKANQFKAFPQRHIQHFSRQLLQSVAFLHGLTLVHTDLKPENILLVNGAWRDASGNTTDTTGPNSPTRKGKRNNNAPARILADPDIRLIDFGSAAFDSEFHASMVSTRHYRAPEIVLGLGWSYPCDVWSVGCILIEFLMGEALFQTHDNLEHLAIMEQILGPIPQTMLRVVSERNPEKASQFFRLVPRKPAPNEVMLEPHGYASFPEPSASAATSSPSPSYTFKLDYPNQETSESSIKFVSSCRTLDAIILSPGHRLHTPRTPATKSPRQPSRFLTEFLDLVRRCLVYDPEERITAREALHHPFFDVNSFDDELVEAEAEVEAGAAAKKKTKTGSWFR